MDLFRITSKEWLIQKRNEWSSDPFPWFSALFGISLLVRFVFVAYPQPGYIHPDEFMQSIEVLVSDIFEIKRQPIAEFDTDFPLRSLTTINLFFGLMLRFYKIIIENSPTVLEVTARHLIFLCRVLMAALSIRMDYCLIRICVLYGQEAISRLLIFASSYVVLVYGIRTFSNTIEMILFSELLFIAVEHFMQEKDDAINKVKNRKDSEWILFRLAGIVVVGVFNRPTFLIYAFAPLFYFFTYRRSMARILLNVIRFTYYVLPLSVLFVWSDSILYGKDITHSILSFDLEMIRKNAVVTPLNFFYYNSNTTNLQEHGLHPFYLHTLVNIPLLFNVLGISGLYTTAIALINHMMKKLYNYFRYGRLNIPVKKPDVVNRMMMLSIAVPLIMLSMIPHQEPRFLIPLTLPFMFLKGSNQYKTPRMSYLFGNGREWSKVVIGFWFITNMVLLFFFGFRHQAGVVSVMNDLAGSVNEALRNGYSVDVFSTSVYTLPKSLILASSYRLNKDINVWPQRGNVNETLKDISKIFNGTNDKLNNQVIYWVTPSEYRRQILDFYDSMPVGMYLQVVTRAKHYSMESVANLPLEWESLKYLYEAELLVFIFKPYNFPNQYPIKTVVKETDNWILHIMRGVQ